MSKCVSEISDVCEAKHDCYAYLVLFTSKHLSFSQEPFLKSRCLTLDAEVHKLFWLWIWVCFRGVWCSCSSVKERPQLFLFADELETLHVKLQCPEELFYIVFYFASYLLHTTMAMQTRYIDYQVSQT